jgi:hypothetical protein
VFRILLDQAGHNVGGILGELVSAVYLSIDELAEDDWVSNERVRHFIIRHF